MDRFLNMIKAQASALDAGQAQPRFGTVTSVDPTACTARVQLQPENVLSGWLPVVSAWTGAKWGVFCPPSTGDQVLVLAQEGTAENGIIIGTLYSAAKSPPPGLVGEFWVVHASGTTLKLTNDGTIHLQGPVNIQGTVVVSGDLLVGGNVSDGIGDLARLRSHYDAHTHVDSRGGATSQANPQD